VLSGVLGNTRSVAPVAPLLITPLAPTTAASNPS
jgi:hypothetical protein